MCFRAYKSSKPVSETIKFKLQCVVHVRATLVKKESPMRFSPCRGRVYKPVFLFVTRSYLPRKFAEAEDLLIRKIPDVNLRRGDSNRELSENSAFL